VSADGGPPMQGADTVLPFACPADHFLPMKHLDNVTEVDVPYRMTGFLSVHEQACTICCRVLSSYRHRLWTQTRGPKTDAAILPLTLRLDVRQTSAPVGCTCASAWSSCTMWFGWMYDPGAHCVMTDGAARDGRYPGRSSSRWRPCEWSRGTRMRGTAWHGSLGSKSPWAPPRRACGCASTQVQQTARPCPAPDRLVSLAVTQLRLYLGAILCSHWRAVCANPMFRTPDTQAMPHRS